MLIFISFLFFCTIFSNQDLSVILNELDKATEESPILNKREETINKTKTIKKFDSSKNKIAKRTKYKKKINFKTKPFSKRKLFFPKKYLKKKKDRDFLNLSKKQTIDKNQLEELYHSTKKNKFYISLGYNLLFSNEKYISESFVEDINNLGGTLDTISFYHDLVISAYYKLFPFFNPYLHFSFLFSNNYTTTVPISYGLDAVNTLVSYNLYSFNFMFGSNYDIFNINSFSFCLTPLLGFSILRGSISLMPDTTSPSVSSSYLGFGGVAFSASLEAKVKLVLSKHFALGINLSYLYLVLQNVNIGSSLGDFALQYKENENLAIYNKATKQMEEFHLDFSGFKTGVFIEIMF